MSADKAKLEITLEGDKAIAEAKKVQKELKDTGAAGKQAGNAVDSGANKGASGLKKMDSAAGGADGSLTTLAVTVLGLGQAITGVTDAVFGFNEKIVALERSTFGLKQMTIELSRREEDLEEILRKGELSAREQERAIEDLALAYEALAIEERTVKAEAEALNGEYVTFAINTGMMIVQSGIAVSSLLTLRAAHATTAGAAGLQSGATLALAGSLKAAAVAMKAFMLSNPVTAAALIASTAAVVAYEQNLLGMRDGIEDLTGLERGSLPTLTGALGLTADATNDAADAARDYMAEAKAFADSVNHNQIPSLNGLESAADSATASMKTLTIATVDFKKKRPLEIVQTALLDAADTFRSATQAKGLIDLQMMQALVDAEEAGLIAKGTAGRFRTESGFNKSGNIRAINIANAIGQFGNFGREGRFATKSTSSIMSLSTASINLLNSARDSGQLDLRGSSTGSRNTKSEKFRRLDQMFGSQSVQVALQFGHIRSSVPRLHSQFASASRLSNIGQGIMNIFQRTGIAIPRLNLRFGMSKSTLGMNRLHNERERSTFFARSQSALAEANAEIAAYNALIAFNPNLAGINLASAGIDRNYLENLLNTERSRIGNISNRLGLTNADIVSMEATQQGLTDIKGMLDFKDRLEQVQTGAV